MQESNDNDQETCGNVRCVREDWVEVTDQEEEGYEGAEEDEEESSSCRRDQGEPL